MQIAFIAVNESTLSGPEFGGELTTPILAEICKGLDAYVNEDVAVEYGGGYVVQPGKLSDANGPDTCAIRIVDGLPQVPGAAAYHDKTDTGASIIWVARDEFSSLTDGLSAMSEGIGHEIAETVGDESAGLWQDRIDGTEEARELCDRLQGSRYQKGGIAVPDFLLRTAWRYGASRPFSKRDALSSIYDVTPDGYVILRQQGQMIQQAQRKKIEVHGPGLAALLQPADRYAQAKLARKRHPISRTFARGVRL
jgi:hypothetical protein